ncbi:MAG: polyprenyl synthetase family protein [Oscillatoria princeps RMCB-10]|nr:polyprenyl synthetase family protein [Oscillatoria princeps RMCB-10]
MAVAYRHESAQPNSQRKGGLFNSKSNAIGNGSHTAPASSHYDPHGTGNGGAHYHSGTAPASSHYDSHSTGNGGVDYHSGTAPASSHYDSHSTGNSERHHNSGTAPASSHESIQANGTANTGLPTGTSPADRHSPPAGLTNGGVSNGNGNGNGNGTSPADSHSPPAGLTNGGVSNGSGNGNSNGTSPADRHSSPAGKANGGVSNGNGNGNGNGTSPADRHSPPAGLTNGGGNGASANPIATLNLPTAPENSSVHKETDSVKLPDGETVQVLTAPAEQKAEFDKKIINEALHSARVSVGVKIQEFIDKKRGGLGSYEPLYEMLADYPFRTGKMLRPTMCVSVARAVGGMGQSALTTAAALELYHNAFLIHDDIEDGSEARRGKETLHHMIGIPRAINVGDATNVLAVGLLLENLPLIGVSKTLDVLQEIELMAQQSVEGQAMELDWVATNASNLTDQDYFKMCVKKTCWYSFMTPCRIGLIVGHPSAHAKDLVEPLAQVTRFGMVLGIAFQIQDDLLNLQGDIKLYGKEIGGDIYEGKRTLMLNHAIAHSSPADSQKIVEILALPRERKTPEQVEFIYDRMQRCGSIDHGWNVARSLANQASEIFEKMDFLQRETPLRASEQGVSAVHDRRFLKELIDYVIYRNV